MTIGEVIPMEPERWPMLARAAQDTRKAETTKIEWIDEHFSPGGLVLKANFNYTEIFRAKSPARVLDRIEDRLHDGQRHIDTLRPHIVTTMGSVYELLGRAPQKNDVLALYVLRDLIELKRWDWIAEVSILATRQEG